MNPPPPSNQPAPDAYQKACDELKFAAISRQKEQERAVCPDCGSPERNGTEPKATPAPAGDDAVRGIVERLRDVQAHSTQRTFHNDDGSVCRRVFLIDEIDLTDAIAALQRLAGENAELRLGIGKVYALKQHAETALAEARRQLEDRDGPDEAIEAMRADLARTREALQVCEALLQTIQINGPTGDIAGARHMALAALKGTK